MSLYDLILSRAAQPSASKDDRKCRACVHPSTRALRSRLRMKAVFLALSFLALASPAGAQTFPELTSRVVDDANIIDIPTEAEIDKKLTDLESKTTIQLVVVTLSSLQGYDIADYGYRLGRHWGIGQEKKNNGALLIVAPNERKVRIEVGYGLEGTVTDAITQIIIQNAILPRFRANDFPGGISRGVDDLIQVMTGDTQYAEEAVKPDESVHIANEETADMFFTAFIFLIIAIQIWRAFSGGSRRRRGRSTDWLATTGGVTGRPWGGGGGWSSGGGFSSGGGGFSGGGGSFGGGGSSGSW